MQGVQSIEELLCSFPGRSEQKEKVNLNTRFLYFISVQDNQKNEYRYIGQARNKQRLDEYCKNLEKISDRKERGKKQGYRAVHYALYKALQKTYGGWQIRDGWRVRFYPLENCTDENKNKLEQRRISEYRCNLNGARTWKISELPTLKLDDLLHKKQSAGNKERKRS